MLLTSTILTDGATGLDTVTGQDRTVPQTDPEFDEVAPNGDLIFSSGNDGTDRRRPESRERPIRRFLSPTIKGVPAGNAGLDDVIKPSATAGTFYLTDTEDQ